MELSQKVSTERSPKTWTSQRSARFTSSDVTLALSTPTLMIESGLVAPHFQGFFCNDSSIKYPRVSHYIIEDSAITTIGFLIFTFIISLGEMILVLDLPLSSQAMVNTYVSLVYRQLGTFIFGAMASSSLTSIAQMTTGHLRPHFLAVCLPDPTTFSCESSYVTNYTCTGNPSDVLEARKSFYSEQASFGMYCMVYLVLYLQARYSGRRKLLRPTIQCCFLFMALLLGYSQTQNHWHHPWDTVIGFLQGAAMALWVAFYIAGLSTSQATPNPSDSRG